MDILAGYQPRAFSSLEEVAMMLGLPGKMGVGVYVVMALEGWMAFCIARHVGFRVRKPSDIWKYFG